MIATVNLDNELEIILDNLAKKFEKKRDEIISEAIKFYAKSIDNRKKQRLHKAIAKTSQSDYNEYKILEEILDDSFKG